MRAALDLEKIGADILLRGCDVRYVECRTVVLYGSGGLWDGGVSD